jgi:site-specific DNA-adenine methylase
VKPFFTYYGSKWRAAGSYPAPLCETIIEPFAGAAGYSVRHYRRKVILIDLDPVVCGVWRYLISASSAEIEALPLLREGESVEDLSVSQEARWLIGFCCTKGSAKPNKTLSAWGRDPKYSAQFWGEKVRERIARQVEKIKHWTIIEGDYKEAPNVEACWFIDPPYEVAGKHYRKKFDKYSELAKWCKSRRGQAIVCEAKGAKWLPFKDHATIKANESKHGKKVSHEVIWTSGLGQRPLFAGMEAGR